MAVSDALGYRQLTSHSWSPWELGKTISHGNKEKKGQIKSETYLVWHSIDLQISGGKASCRVYC